MDNQTAQPKKKESKWGLILGWIVLFVIIIGIAAIGGEKKSPPENAQLQQQVSEIIKFVNSPNGLRLRVQPSLSANVLEILKDKTKVEVLREQKDWSEVKIGEKQGWVASQYLSEEEQADFEVTAEEIYSYHVNYQTDSSIEELVRERYDGKIIEITGIVEKAEDIVEVHKNSIGRSAWVKLHGETLPPFIQDQIDEGRRYYICLADKEGHACVAWVYSSSPHLISGVKKGDRVIVLGQWKHAYGSIVPDLMNSKVKGKLIYEKGSEDNSSESKSSQQNIGEQEGSEVSQQTTEKQKISSSPSYYSLGKSAVVDDIRFTVVKYKVTKECYDKYQSQYYGPIQAPEGARFLWLYVKAINKDEVARKLPYEGTDIYLKYKDNRIYQSVACFIENEYHVDEKVYPEISREGWVLYEIPENLDLSLTYVIIEVVELGEKKGEVLWKLGS